MHRRLSALVNKSERTIRTVPQYHNQNIDNEKELDTTDDESKVSTAVRPESLPVPSLKVKRVDYYYSRWGNVWKYRNMNSKVTVETLPIMNSEGNDPWKDYSFVIVRTLPNQDNEEPTFKLVVKSGYIIKMCKDVIQEWPGISWNSDPLELDPEIFLTFFPQITAYRDALQSKPSKSTLDNHILASTDLLLSSLTTDYRTTLASIERLTSHGEITFERLHSILIPRTLLVAQCAITGLPRVFRLVSAQRIAFNNQPIYQLTCENVDAVEGERGHNRSTVGRVQTMIILRYFKGTVDIPTLDAYPIKYHPDEEALRKTLLNRGKKWVSLIGVHHKQYDGVAAVRIGEKLVKNNVKGRIMVDRATFRRLNPNYQFPTPAPPKLRSTRFPPPQMLPPMPETPQMHYYDPGPIPGIPPSHPSMWEYNNGMGGPLLVESRNDDKDAKNIDLSEEDLVLTPTVVYGFSLSDKIWLEFNVEKVEEVDWNVDAFANLVLPTERKDLLQSLVEVHHQETGFDDFIKGKGHGLVVNLFGPPGVGKTFSAEATSEHVRRPLYVVGGGDLGTKAATLDSALERIFDIATAWKAIVLIDEADVFLEQRSLHDLERNAMVAVFLRHVEYYRGILFLTTNRVQAFDEAFLSRIHVALHFRALSSEAKEQVWTAFIRRLSATTTAAVEEITPEQIRDLAKRDVNGRQIKNAVRTAQSLARSRGKNVGFEHLTEALDAMDEFTRQFRGLRGGVE